MTNNLYTRGYGPLCKTASTPQPLKCKICEKTYKYPKARANHELKNHGIVAQPSNVEKQISPESEHKISDKRYIVHNVVYMHYSVCIYIHVD
jgi:hypothetical protein